MASGLTQVLSDGTHTYLYGNMRIAQQDSTSTAYFLPDALGSIRQLVDETGTLTLSQAYQPYGETLNSSGSGASPYGFAGEWTDSQTGLQYLRARYYAPGVGRFLTKDAWVGDYNKPLSLNAWNYVYANPINYIDPSGYVPCASIPPGPDRDACLENEAAKLKPPFEIGANELRVTITAHQNGPTGIPDDCAGKITGILAGRRRITATLQPARLGTITFTYNVENATQGFYFGDKAGVLSTGQESIAIRALLAEMGGRVLPSGSVSSNIHGVQEAVGILYTAMNRSAVGRCGSIAGCLTDFGQYATWKNNNAFDPQCQLGGNCYRRYGINENLGFPPPQLLLERVVDYAATAYWLVNTGYLADFTHGAEDFIHRCGQHPEGLYNYGDITDKCRDANGNPLHPSASFGPTVFYPANVRDAGSELAIVGCERAEGQYCMAP